MTDEPASGPERKAAPPAGFSSDEIANLRAIFAAEAAKFEAAANSPTAASARDESGSITVELGDAAQPVTIKLTDGWRSSYEPAELGGAIVQTIAKLATERLGEWGASLEAAGKAPAPAASTPPATPKLPTSSSEEFKQSLRDLGENVDGRVVLGQMMDMLREINQGIEATIAIASTRLQAPQAGGAADRVLVTVNGTGVVTSIVFANEWLLNRSAFEIAGQVNETIARAVAAAASAQPANILDGTPLEKYGTVLNDPDALARMLMQKD